MLRGLYHRLGDHLARLPIGWYTGRRVGEVSTLASRGVLDAMSVMAHLLAPFVGAVLTPLTIVVVMICVDVRIGLLTLLAVPLVVAVQRWTGRQQAAADGERREREEEATGRVLEHLRAQPVLRAGGRSTERFELLDHSLRKLQRASRRSVLAALPGVLGLTLLVQVVFTAVLALATDLGLGGSTGGIPSLMGNPEIPEILAILVLAARCADPVLSLAELGGSLRAAKGELIRLDEVLSTGPLPEPSSPLHPEGSDIELHDVRFGRGDRKVLSGVSFTVPAGQRLAIVGPSGSGKSTLLQVIARFHDVDSGTIRIGGADVRQIATEELMAQFAVVFQDVHLFDGTIEENIRLGRPDADPAAVRRAATAARLDEVIERLPDRWQTNVGEGGSALSGGERQRVSIARALLKDAPIVLLDEVTSALDPLNEAAVHEGITRLLAGRTVVMVAHRLRLVSDADRIVLLEGGRIREQGIHRQLLRAGGRYQSFFASD